MDEKMLIEAMHQMMAEQSKQMADMMDALKKRYAHLGKFFRVKICPRFI